MEVGAKKTHHFDALSFINFDFGQISIRHYITSAPF